MGVFGKTALKAVELYKNAVTKDPAAAWQRAIKDFTESPSSQKKGCPKSAFLGLCEEGLVSGIPPGEYTKSVKNKTYALRALEALRKNPALALSSSALWNSIEKDAGSDQGEMDVVIALWNAGLIK
ncbi:MAG: hypothetical protein LBP71_06630 [Spirochaetaceae bacterium]|jgi:hypothetical protein|nr:hypothetical protein [Spirochaetaceae bacterium]